MWFETHAHLSDPKFDQDRDAVVQRALDAGVAFIIEIADGPDEWEKAKALAQKHSAHMRWAAGLHPYYADQGSKSVFDALRRHAADPLFVAIGEVGLDYAKATIPAETQTRTLITAVELALEVKKPLIIHCRDAFDDLHPLLEPYFGCREDKSVSPGVVHCFTGTEEDALRLVDMGFYLGVDGPVTYPKSDGLRTALKKVPADRLVVETDSPYLPPQTHRGQRNEPIHIPAIAAKLAEVKGLNAGEFATALFSNSKNLFRLK